MLHLKMIFRSWYRSGLSTLISLVSLTIGLICSTVLILFVLGEYKVTDTLGDTKDIFMVESTSPFYSDKNVKSASIPPYLALDIADKFGDLEIFATIKEGEWEHKDGIREINYEKGIYAVTPEFINMFDIPILEGDLKKTLSSASEVAVTHSYMQYIYGKDAVIGDRIRAESGGNSWINGVQSKRYVHDVVITTILDESKRTPLRYGALTSLVVSELNEFRRGYSGSYYSFIKLRDKGDINVLKEKISSDTVNFKRSRTISFIPFSDIYFDKSPRDTKFGDGRFIVRRDPSILSIGLMVALAVLLIAAFNYVNITMTRARNRLKNIAGQRIFGATKWNVRLQTALDTTLLVLISFSIALLIINTILPQFNGFMDCNIALSDIFASTNLLIVLAVLLVLILMPSLYILLKIEVTSPMETFKNPMGRNVKISSIMVVAQFVISVVLIAVSINISRQMNFIANDRPSAASIIRLLNAEEDAIPKEFVDRVKNLASVESYTTQGPSPTSSISSNGKNVNEIRGTNDVVDFYEMNLLDGRRFVDGENNRNIIVNEALIRQFEIEQPAIGRSFFFNGDTLSVIGLVKDFIYEDAHKNIQPIFIKYYSNTDPMEEYWELYLKVNGDVATQIDEIQAIWAGMYPDLGSISVKTMVQIYKEMHQQDQRLLTMIKIFMYISILLTALGLFGLAFYTVGRRRKEIAIRKIHGSTTTRVILLLCRTFAVWVGVAFVIAVPVAYYLSYEWLSTFIYRVPVVAWVFLVTAAVAAAVTFITVIFQTWKAASANPAHSIKGE